MEFVVLGDIEVRAGGRRVEIGHERQQCVLAALLVDAGRPVPAERLLDRVWGERAPQRVRGVLHSYLSRLRRIFAELDGPAIARRPAGYVLDTDPMSVDLHRFRVLATRARATADAGGAYELFEQALGLWCGEPFGALDTPWLAEVRAALQRERLAAELDRNDVALAAGRHAGLLADLALRAGADPLDERLAGQLMLALYRCGRQADALRVYRDLHRRLAAELGADPVPPLQRLHQQILAGHPGLAARAPNGGPPRLPAPPAGFAGRCRELAELGAVLTGRPGPGGAAVIAVVGGTGGMGKTWLALRWAHDHADRFPDGQLYLNLRGYDPCGPPVAVAEALRGLLDALGVDPAAIPVEVDGQAALYRRLVAGRRLLIVLDNARDSNQVTPLLPGSPTAGVLVTSRHRLGGLITAYGARPLTLAALGDAEARDVLGRQLGPGRTALEPVAVDALLGQCAGLPLALSVVASRAALQPGLPLAALATELGEASARLDGLDAGELTANVRAVLSCSLEALPAPTVRAFALLGRAPGPEIGLDAAAGLLGVPVAHGRTLLRELADAHLVQEPAPGRYRMHDLVRLYAAEQTADGAAAAAGRLLDHYLHTACAADHLLDPHRRTIGPAAPVAGIAGRHAALDWFATEHPALLAAVRQAERLGLDTHVWRLAWALNTYLARRGHWRHGVQVQESALAAVGRLADPAAEALVRRQLAYAYTFLGRNADAVPQLDLALDLFAAAGDLVGQGDAHRGLARAHARRHRFFPALDHAERALRLYQAAGHRSGEASALNAVGWFRAHLGDLDAALGYCERAARLHREIDDPYREALALDSLGYIHRGLGEPAAAIRRYLRACALFREVGDRYQEADSMVGLGDAQSDAGNTAGARATWCRALTVLERLNPSEADRIRARLGGQSVPDSMAAWSSRSSSAATAPREAISSAPPAGRAPTSP
ncbi:AfsR/SARP family transcriptional regulator [Actinoplanes subtropicus]|uniref:AfsR/SARP family transcriptional regulator n=1 Tax=Actinoplanes subtropicus TaxID=543632 RepID=UPI0012FBB623|nr:BTAD domain-containing putative transcriptional regulator [Actinoplanes subtropicus]